jgi:hypothetical protein
MSTVSIPSIDAVIGPMVEPQGMVFFDEKCWSVCPDASAAAITGRSASGVVA